MLKRIITSEYVIKKNNLELDIDLDIIDEINQSEIPEGTILVSLDIENMFPSIDNKRGLDTLRKTLEKRNTKNPPTECILEALELILVDREPE